MDNIPGLIEVDYPAYRDQILKDFGEDFTGVIKDSDGVIIYFKDGGWHREDGPAFISPEGVEDNQYWLDNTYYDFHAWLDKINPDEVTKTYYLIIYG